MVITGPGWAVSVPLLVARVGLCCRLYVSEERTRLPRLQNYLERVELFPYDQVLTDLQGMVRSVGEGKVWISDFSSERFVGSVPSNRRCALLSPIQLLKAVKNSTEIAGMRACHVSCGCGRVSGGCGHVGIRP